MNGQDKPTISGTAAERNKMTLTPDEIIKALKCCGDSHVLCDECPNWTGEELGMCCTDLYPETIALITSLAAKLAEKDKVIAELKAENHDVNNELCLNCGFYRNRYLGQCDDCRWAESEE